MRHDINILHMSSGSFLHRFKRMTSQVFVSSDEMFDPLQGLFLQPAMVLQPGAQYSTLRSTVHPASCLTSGSES